MDRPSIKCVIKKPFFVSFEFNELDQVSLNSFEKQKFFKWHI